MVKIPVRFKRVAAAFDEVSRVRASGSSSGSEHSPEDQADLSDLVESFIEREGKLIEARDDKIRAGKEKEGEDLESGINSYWSGDDDDDTKEMLQRVLGCNGFGDNDERQKILDEVGAACRIIGERSSRGFKRQLMTHLRSRGFDAGLCKSKWEKLGRNPAGDYEYVDVNIKGTRYIVEVFLAGEFEIARPTSLYLSVLNLFPKIFIGKPEELKQVVRLMCNAMRLSIRSMDMHVAPWRRNGYMQAKWFGRYRRTVNEARASHAHDENAFAGKRSVGFQPTEAISYHCKDDIVSRDGLRVGQLTVVFNGSGGGMPL